MPHLEREHIPVLQRSLLSFKEGISYDMRLISNFKIQFYKLIAEKVSGCEAVEELHREFGTLQVSGRKLGSSRVGGRTSADTG